MNASPSPAAAHSPTERPPSGQVRVDGERLYELENTEREYRVTVTTLAIVVEQLLELRAQLTGEQGDTHHVEPETRENPPDLRAGVNSDGQLWMKVSR